MIPLPMTPETCLGQVIRPALNLLPVRLRGELAELMILAIMIQESGLAHRQQVGGPAHGLAQFEKAGGVRGVLKHPSSAGMAFALCGEFNIPPTEAAVYWELPENDELAAGFARLLLWTDPQRLPALGDVDGAWDMYQRNWRPGRPHRDAWPANYAAALATLT